MASTAVSKTESQTAKMIPVLSNTCDRYICQGVLKCTTSLPRFRYVNRIHMSNTNYASVQVTHHKIDARDKMEHLAIVGMIAAKHKCISFSVTQVYPLSSNFYIIIYIAIKGLDIYFLYSVLKAMTR